MMRAIVLWMMGLFAGAFVLAFWTPTPTRNPLNEIELKPTALVSHPPLDEMSGIARSRTYPDTYWVHNDSGDRARIFAIRLDGSVIVPPFVSRRDSSTRPEQQPTVFEGIQIDGASNIDWEDITIDGDTLYIADMGNNGNARRDLAVYVLKEPNPEQTTRTHILQRIPVAYPDQSGFPPADRWHYDCEAVFVMEGKLYFLTKHRKQGSLNTPENGTNLYRLDTTHTDKVNLLTKVDSHSDLGGWVTAAELSPDGRTLAVLCQVPQQSVWLFEKPAQGDKFLSEGKARQIRFRNGKQCEAIEWVDDQQLVITNEQGEIFVLDIDKK